MKCKRCGFKIPDNAKFCASCGVNLAEYKLLQDNLTQDSIKVENALLNENVENGNNAKISEALEREIEANTAERHEIRKEIFEIKDRLRSLEKSDANKISLEKRLEELKALDLVNGEKRDQLDARVKEEQKGNSTNNSDMHDGIANTVPENNIAAHSEVVSQHDINKENESNKYPHDNNDDTSAPDAIVYNSLDSYIESNFDSFFSNNRNPEFSYIFRKNFKGATENKFFMIGYDYSPNMSNKMEGILGSYIPCGDYILYASSFGKCPLVVTDRVLYIDSYAFLLEKIKEIVTYGQIPTMNYDYETAYAVFIYEYDKLTRIVVPFYHVIIDVLRAINISLTPMRRKGQRYISDTNEYLSYCLKCNGEEVREGLLVGCKCKKCGNENGSTLFRSRTRGIFGNQVEEKMKDNLRKFELNGVFADEEKYIKTVRALAPK